MDADAEDGDKSGDAKDGNKSGDDKDEDKSGDDTKADGDKTVDGAAVDAANSPHDSDDEKSTLHGHNSD